MLEVKGYKVADELFTKGMSSGHGPCACVAACCRGGVFADLAERDRVLSHRDQVLKYLDETQPHDVTLWFEQEEHADPDFPSGRCVGTAEFNEKCAFLDKQGRCSLQVAAIGEGMDKWALKPLFCVLFPVEISEKTICYDDLLQGEAPCCSVSNAFEVPLFEVCREELTHVVGEDGFEQMKKHYQNRKDTQEKRNP